MNWIEKEKTDSTNNLLYGMIKQGRCAFPAVVIAEMQTSGKGRRSRRWHSEKGGLYFSYCQGAVEFQDILIQPLKIAAAIHRYIVRETSMEGFFVKWPNDVYYRDKKIAGVLSKTLSSANGNYVVTGAGVNVMNYPPIEKSTNIREIFPEWEKSPREMAAEILAIAETFTERKDIVEYINSNLWGKDAEKNVLIEGEEIRGIIRGMGMDLALDVETDGIVRKIMMGEVL